jgi:hypothetical protein
MVAVGSGVSVGSGDAVSDGCTATITVGSTLGMVLGAARVLLGGISVRVGSGVRVGEAVFVGVKVTDGLNPAVRSADESPAGVGVSSMSEVSPLLELNERIIPNVRASARVPITTMATINSLLRSRRCAIP